MQRELPLISVMHRAPKAASEKAVVGVHTVVEAIEVSMRGCNGKGAYLAACIGKSASYVSMLRTGERPLPQNKILRANLVKAICLATGTTLLQQFLERTDKPDRLDRLAAMLRAAA